MWFVLFLPWTQSRVVEGCHGSERCPSGETDKCPQRKSKVCLAVEGGENPPQATPQVAGRMLVKCPVLPHDSAVMAILQGTSRPNFGPTQEKDHLRKKETHSTGKKLYLPSRLDPPIGSFRLDYFSDTWVTVPVVGPQKRCVIIKLPRRKIHSFDGKGMSTKETNAEVKKCQISKYQGSDVSDRVYQENQQKLKEKKILPCTVFLFCA